MVRGARIAWALAAVGALAVAGCKGSDEPAAAAEQALAATEEIAQKEDDLLSRRDALVKARERIRAERDELRERRERAVAAGEDPSEIDAKTTELLSEERALIEEEEQLNSRYREIIRQRREMIDALATGGAAGADQTAQVAARERSMASRERDVASREASLSDREARLAERERALARREAETCGVAQPATIIQTVDAKGSQYTRKDVEPLLTNARRRMAKKGILSSDLPGPARDLEREATKAMAGADYGRARFAAAQLVSTVRSIDVDKAFISAKIARLNDAIGGKKLSNKVRGDVDALFREATEDYGDGKYPAANAKLNRIYSMLD